MNLSKYGQAQVDSVTKQLQWYTQFGHIQDHATYYQAEQRHAEWLQTARATFEILQDPWKAEFLLADNQPVPQQHQKRYPVILKRIIAATTPWRQK